MEEKINYPLSYSRRKTVEINVGNVKIGGNNPIVIQSMLTSHTHDTQSCINEMKGLVDVGCELIRITLPTRRDLDNIPNIREVMENEGITVPLVADIHFTPHLALDACELFEKVRINPGNYSDRPKNSSDKSKRQNDFEEGRLRLKERIKQLAFKLIQYNRALRVGVNHGSLSSRMIQEYGDTPLGMVNSAIETIEFFEEFGFSNIVISLKSSNPLIVQKAYRLLCEKEPNQKSYPFHLGVTEAGNEEMGRAKSLSGITSLLMDGIGDTIRVSLTEPSVNEIQFAKKLVNFVTRRVSDFSDSEQDRKSDSLEGDINITRIVNNKMDLSGLVIGGGENIKIGVPEQNTSLFPEYDFTYTLEDQVSCLGNEQVPTQALKYGSSQEITPSVPVILDSSTNIFELRRIHKNKIHQSNTLGYMAPDEINSNDFDLEVFLSNAAGEGLLDFILLPPDMPVALVSRLKNAFQATRIKLTETDYIACPSCGRTLFELTSVTSKVKQATSHLKGLKIGIMGCIVNGPGEMADADFGYVGSGTGKIDLYVGRERVKKNVRENEAVQELVTLIKDRGKWVEPNVAI